ncbi:MAG: outer membrane beta-barrel protein [Burkholderiales bacterium]|nr:outer membrane beta-barrel protein [Burkholderiales bacterium]
MKIITKVLPLLLPVAFMANVSAQEAPKVAEDKPLKFVAGMGLTFGGEKLSTVSFTDGTSSDIRSGGLVQLVGGVDYRINKQFSVQSSVSYHVDGIGASNGGLTFSRFPIELLGYYHINDQWRVGGGVRYVTNIRMSGSGAAAMPTLSFDNATGGVLEAEYFTSTRLGVKFRLVKEEYKISGTNQKVSGNHGGVFANMYF